MRIVLIGQAAFGEKVLERLLERKEDVVAVYCPPDRPGGKPDPLKELAQECGIAVLQPPRMKSAETIQEYKTLNPDLNILAFVTRIVPNEILQFPRHGSIQFHPSLLPRHRGRSAINWAVIQGDEKTGLTIFWVDEGIDTGPILLQKEVEITPDDTTGSIYFNKLFPLGVDALMQSLDLVKAGKAPRIAQDEARATYEPPCEARHAEVDWAKPVQEVYNLIRGCDPQPGAHTTLRGKRLQLYSAELLLDHPLNGSPKPGTIIEAGEQGILVAGGGGAILVKKVRPAGGGKISATDFVKEEGVKPGDKLGG
jgi:methionyl-tRNA formyltransferase